MHCDIIKDLIPSYVDGICSEKTKVLVDEHIQECDACRELINSLKEEIIPQVNVSKAKQPWLKVKKHTLFKIICSFIMGSLFLIVLYVFSCTMSGEGLTLTAAMYRDEADEFLHYLSISDYESAAPYLSFYGSDDVNEEREIWIQKMKQLELPIHSCHWTPLYSDDGIASSYVTMTLKSGEIVEFRVNVQGEGLSLSSIYVVDNIELSEKLQESMSAHNPG